MIGTAFLVNPYENGKTAEFFNENKDRFAFSNPSRSHRPRMLLSSGNFRGTGLDVTGQARMQCKRTFSSSLVFHRYQLFSPARDAPRRVTTTRLTASQRSSVQGNSTVTNFAAFFPTLVTLCVKPPGTHLMSPAFSCTGVALFPSSLRRSKSLTAISRCGPL